MVLKQLSIIKDKNDNNNDKKKFIVTNHLSLGLSFGPVTYKGRW